MNRSIVRNLTGLASRRGAIAGALLAAGSFAAPANAFSGRICIMGDSWGIWVDWDFGDVFGNFDPATGAGAVDFNVMTPQSPDDVVFPYASTSGDLVVLNGPATMVMGTFDVVGGLGTGQCGFELPNIWVTGSDWGIHLILNPFNAIAADMQLTGFTAGGEGIYEAHGLAIPVDFEVTGPDGITQVVTQMCTTIELRTPLDLSPPCPADIDGNGILNLDDINMFAQNFIGGCP